MKSLHRTGRPDSWLLSEVQWVHDAWDTVRREYMMGLWCQLFRYSRSYDRQPSLCHHSHLLGFWTNSGQSHQLQARRQWQLCIGIWLRVWFIFNKRKYIQISNDRTLVTRGNRLIGVTSISLATKRMVPFRRDCWPRCYWNDSVRKVGQSRVAYQIVRSNIFNRLYR